MDRVAETRTGSVVTTSRYHIVEINCCCRIFLCQFSQQLEQNIPKIKYNKMGKLDAGEVTCRSSRRPMAMAEPLWRMTTQMGPQQDHGCEMGPGIGRAVGRKRGAGAGAGTGAGTGARTGSVSDSELPGSGADRTT